MKQLAIALAFLFLLIAAPHDASAQSAATPVLRNKAIFDNLRNKDSTAAELTRINARLLPLAAPAFYVQFGSDPSVWTNVQKTTAVNEFLRLHIRGLVVDVSGDQERRAAAVAAAIAAAGADID